MNANMTLQDCDVRYNERPSLRTHQTSIHQILNSAIHVTAKYHYFNSVNVNSSDNMNNSVNMVNSVSMNISVNMVRGIASLCHLILLQLIFFAQLWWKKSHSLTAPLRILTQFNFLPHNSGGKAPLSFVGQRLATSFHLARHSVLKTSIY